MRVAGTDPSIEADDVRQPRGRTAHVLLSGGEWGVREHIMQGLFSLIP